MNRRSGGAASGYAATARRRPFKAANAAKAGERMKVLRWIQGGDKPEGFPTLTVTGNVIPLAQ